MDTMPLSKRIMCANLSFKTFTTLRKQLWLEEMQKETSSIIKAKHSHLQDLLLSTLYLNTVFCQGVKLFLLCFLSLVYKLCIVHSP